MKNYSSYPLESLLRSPLEWWSCLFYVLAALLIYFKSPYFLLTPFLAKILTMGLGLLALLRFFQGYQVFRYQRNLQKLPFYALSSDELPISNSKLFLGKGFLWQPIHTQRLFDLKQSQPTQKAQKAQKTEKIDNKQNRVAQRLGGNPTLHGIEPHERNVFLNLSEKVAHTMILGTTRCGKTRLLELMISSDIRRQDSAVVVFDPKGDPDLLRRICHEAKVVNRTQDVIIFHLGYPTHSARYNPVGNFSRITEVANRIANQLPSSGESAAFKEFGWRFVNIIANALVALGKRPNYKDMDRYILNIDPLLLSYCEKKLNPIDSTWQEKIKKRASCIDEKTLPFHLKMRSRFMIALVNHIDSLKWKDDVYNGLKAIFNYDQTYFQKITASLSPLFSKLTTGKISELISPNYFDLEDKRPIFDWLQVIRGKKIVYVGLDALSDATVASAVGNSMFADLCSTIGQIYKFGVQEGIANRDQPKTYYSVNAYSDEFNELAGDEFIPLVNKGGGAGLQLTVATQTASDVEARLGGRAKANQIFGNFNTLICFRVIDESTARLLTEKLPQRVQVKSLIHSSSVQDETDLTQKKHFSTHQEDRIVTTEIPLISPEDLMQLPKGQAFCLLDGGQLWKVRFPLPQNNELHDIPETVEKMIEQMEPITNEEKKE